MKKTIFLLAIATTLLIIACSNQDKTISVTETITGKKKSVEPKILYSSSVIINQTDVVIYPLSLNRINYDEYSRSGQNNYWNIIFNNVVSGKSELLTRKKLIINSFKIGNHENSPSHSLALANQFIYYEVTDADSDGDKKLTSKDANKLFISNLEGKGFLQISPKDYAVHSWKIDESHDLILMDLVKDSNGDKEFNDKDEIEHFMYNLKTKIPAKPVFDKLFDKQVKTLAKQIL